MRDAGYERRWTRFTIRGRAILSALNGLGIEGPSDSFDRHIFFLIEAQMRSRTPEEFKAFVDNLIVPSGIDDGDDEDE
jgi:hypothetical protein